jgi:hypothetical protein
MDGPVTTWGEALVGLLTGLSVVSLFAVSSMMLTMIGIDYETAGGSPLTKIHPATYLALAAVAAWVVTGLNVGAILDDILTHHKGTVVFLGGWTILLLHIVLVQKTPITMVLDTFLLPMLLLLLLVRISEGGIRMLAIAIHVLMITNALLGLVEFASGWRLTPLVAGGVELTSDWRSSALLGHPLANATVTGSYILVLMLGGGRDLPGWLRTFALAIQLPAMAVFAGRAAIVLLIVFGGFLAARQLIRVIAGRAIRLCDAMALVAISPLAATGVAVLGSSGFFDKFLERFVSDEGSAESRIGMLHMLGQVPLTELLFAPDPELVATLQRMEGLEFGIESFWVAMIAYYGIAVSGLFFISFFAFLRDLWRAAKPQSLWILVFFVVVCSTSASLSGKTTSFAVTVALTLVLLRRDAADNDRSGDFWTPRSAAC